MPFGAETGAVNQPVALGVGVFQQRQAFACLRWVGAYAPLGANVEPVTGRELLFLVYHFPYENAIPLQNKNLSPTVISWERFDWEENCFWF